MKSSPPVISLKEKIIVLKAIKSPTLSPETLFEYLKFADLPEMAIPILSKTLSHLIDIDAQISAMYKTFSDDQWEMLFSENGVSICDNLEAKALIDCFFQQFLLVNEKLLTADSSTVIKVLAPIFKVRTKNIQFLAFLIAKDNPKQILGYLLSKTKTSPLVYSSFLASLLVRLKIDKSIKNRCFDAFSGFVVKEAPSSTVLYLLLLQNLLYILCFKDFTPSPPVLDTIKKAYDQDLFGLLNKEVVSRFCSIHGFKEPSYLPMKSESFQFFPFDLPIIPNLAELIQNDYLLFVE
ncbi:hypothetical protein GINT2_001185 [Glugoides intestinalis]